MHTHRVSTASTLPRECKEYRDKDLKAERMAFVEGLFSKFNVLAELGERLVLGSKKNTAKKDMSTLLTIIQRKFDCLFE